MFQTTNHIKLCVFLLDFNSHVTCLLLEHDRHVRRRSHGNRPTQWTFGVPTILHTQRNQYVNDNQLMIICQDLQ